MRRNKYGVAPREQRTDEAGIVHDSKGEMGRWRELQEMERRGEISDLYRQVGYPLVVREIQVAKYVADFEYYRDGQHVVEDWKPGVRTGEYLMKKKLMRALHGIEIYESGRKPKKARPRKEKKKCNPTT